ncbi:MAG: 3-deoxy-8-phosphooctulonate synthase [Pseudomonadota bacterium]|nr:3-deoxy-8-phosphooctulonate synthase [Pseudomonadota bacterium]
MTAKSVHVGTVTFGNDLPFVLIAGPCQIESRDMALDAAGFLSKACAAEGVPFVFKSSYDKANRTSLNAPRGIGMEKGLDILAEIKDGFGCPILTDVHLPQQCASVAEVADILQIPAFLCRQTDLLLAAAATGKAINVKKGQFMAPWDMGKVAEKISVSGNDRILLCDRGTSFGYNTLVTDIRGLPIMAATGYPVVFDATHSVQQPGGLGGSSGGQREFVIPLARAAAAVGIAALFVEAHRDPDKAMSDGPNMLPLSDMPAFIRQIRTLDALTKEISTSGAVAA